jgi:LytR cell envelope-related transcriptional attenuator
VIWKLQHNGVIELISEVTSLLSNASEYLITDPHWNLLDFATNMRALSGKNLQFYTAPIVGYATIDKQDVNEIDIPTIQAAIKRKFTAPPSTKKAAAKPKSTKATVKIPPASSVTVDVYNGAGVPGLAGGVSTALSAKGYKAGTVTNATAQSQTVIAGTQVFYGKETAANAAKIAGYFGATAKALNSLPAGHVEVLLGTGSTVVPATLTPAVATPAASSAASTSAGNNGAAGGAVSVAAHAKFGIPCVN